MSLMKDTNATLRFLRMLDFKGFLLFSFRNFTTEHANINTSMKDGAFHSVSNKLAVTIFCHPSFRANATVRWALEMTQSKPLIIPDAVSTRHWFLQTWMEVSTMPVWCTCLQTKCPRFFNQLLASETFSEYRAISTMSMKNMKTSAVVAKFAWRTPGLSGAGWKMFFHLANTFF